MTEQQSEGNESTKIISPVAEQIRPLLTGLLYPSESDEPVEWVICPLKTHEPLTVSQLKEWLMLPPSVSVEIRSEADFWQPVTAEEDWYRDEEKARTAAFKQLQTLMQPLPDRQLFRVGETEIDLYLLGRLPDETWAGLKTKVIET